VLQHISENYIGDNASGTMLFINLTNTQTNSITLEKQSNDSNKDGFSFLPNNDIKQVNVDTLKNCFWVSYGFSSLTEIVISNKEKISHNQWDHLLLPKMEDF
jgi:hypothetical protein